MFRVAVLAIGLFAAIEAAEPFGTAHAAAILTHPTLSPGAEPDSEEAFRFCVGSSASDERVSSCIRSTVDSCIARIDDAGGTDLNYSICEKREAAFWDRLLNERYRSLMAQFADDKAKQGRLKAGQQGWLKLRDNFCGIIADMQGSTYYVSHMFNDCQLLFTARQVIELNSLGEVLRR